MTRPTVWWKRLDDISLALMSNDRQTDTYVALAQHRAAKLNRRRMCVQKQIESAKRASIQPFTEWIQSCSSRLIACSQNAPAGNKLCRRPVLPLLLGTHCLTDRLTAYPASTWAMSTTPAPPSQCDFNRQNGWLRRGQLPQTSALPHPQCDTKHCLTNSEHQHIGAKRAFCGLKNTKRRFGSSRRF